MFRKALAPSERSQFLSVGRPGTNALLVQIGTRHRAVCCVQSIHLEQYKMRVLYEGSFEVQ